ncbi:MAG: zinc-ribbon domain-containing protein [Oscillospiraceae bacterium]|jgi:hypothetical protein|nr:zinc-ribbon domain-containing protein [Oscillospiraceae bacterium]
MFCSYCGKQLPDKSKFCSACGKPTILSVQAPVDPETVFTKLPETVENAPVSTTETVGNAENAPVSTTETVENAENTPVSATETVGNAENAPFSATETVESAENAPVLATETVENAENTPVSTTDTVENAENIQPIPLAIPESIVNPLPVPSANTNKNNNNPNRKKKNKSNRNNNNNNNPKTTVFGDKPEEVTREPYSEPPIEDVPKKEVKPEVKIISKEDTPEVKITQKEDKPEIKITQKEDKPEIKITPKEEEKPEIKVTSKEEEKTEVKITLKEEEKPKNIAPDEIRSQYEDTGFIPKQEKIPTPVVITEEVQEVDYKPVEHTVEQAQEKNTEEPNPLLDKVGRNLDIPDVDEPSPIVTVNSGVSIRPTVSAGTKVLSVFLAVILCICTLATPVLYGVSKYFNKDLPVVVEDLNIKELSDDIDYDLAKEIKSNLAKSDIEKYNVKEKGINNILEDAKLDTLSKLVKQYVLAFKIGDEHYYIQPHYIIDLVDENKKAIEKGFDYELTDKDYNEIEQRINDTYDLSQTSVHRILKEADIAVWIPQVLLASYPYLVGFGLLIVLCALILFMNRRRLFSSLLYIAVPFILGGLVNIVSSVICDRIYKGRYAPIVTEFAEPLKTTLLVCGSILLIAGIIAVILKIVANIIVKISK